MKMDMKTINDSFELDEASIRPAEAFSNTRGRRVRTRIPLERTQWFSQRRRAILGHPFFLHRREIRGANTLGSVRKEGAVNPCRSSLNQYVV